MSFTWGKEDYCATCVTHKWSGIDLWLLRNLCGIHGTQYYFLFNGKKSCSYKMLSVSTNIQYFNINHT